MSDFDTQAKAFSTEIEKELGEGELNFPTVLELSLRIKRVADDPDSTLEQLAALIRIEPVLAARVLQMANSVLFNPGGIKVSSIANAVQRVGITSVRATALIVAVEQLCQEHRSPALRLLATSVWKHSIDVAAWAYSITRHLRIGNPDVAMLAGLMADMGQLYLIARAARYPAITTDPARFADLVTVWHQGVAKAILEAMNLPTEILDAFDFDNPYGGSWPPRTLGEVLFVAGLAADSDNPFDPLHGEVRRNLLEIAKFRLDAPKFDQLLAAAELERDELLTAFKS